METLTCQFCGKPIPPTRKSLNGKPTKFCRRNCAQRSSMLEWLKRQKKK